jgi:hypothetical protein
MDVLHVYEPGGLVAQGEDNTQRMRYCLRNKRWRAYGIIDIFVCPDNISTYTNKEVKCCQ